MNQREVDKKLRPILASCGCALVPEWGGERDVMGRAVSVAFAPSSLVILEDAAAAAAWPPGRAEGLVVIEHRKIGSVSRV